MAEWVYLESGEMVLDTDRVVLVDPSLEGTVRDMPYFVPVHRRWWFRIPIAGELGVIGDCRIVVSSDASAAKDVEALRRALKE